MFGSVHAWRVNRVHRNEKLHNTEVWVSSRFAEIRVRVRVSVSANRDWTVAWTLHSMWTLCILEVHNLHFVCDSLGRSSSLVTLARPSVSSSLQITNSSFTYASPYLWNQLPSSFRQPHSVHCPPGSPHPTHITSSQSPPSLSWPISHCLYLSLQT